MSILAWIVLGLIAGFIGSKLVNKTGEGVILDIVLGIVGAIVGGYLWERIVRELYSRGRDRRCGRPGCLSRGTGRSIALVSDTCKRATVRSLILPSPTRVHNPDKSAGNDRLRLMSGTRR